MNDWFLILGQFCNHWLEIPPQLLLASTAAFGWRGGSGVSAPIFPFGFLMLC